MAAAYKTARGSPVRGQEDLLHLTATEADGRQQFLLRYDSGGSTALGWLGQNGDTDNSRWQAESLADRTTLTGGGSADGGGQFQMDEPPSGGPISAVLFEVERQG
jgi:hypothetical protein